MERRADETLGPAISVVIPCRNEELSIVACLESVLGQAEPPGGFEVLVVDGMSEDGTREIVGRYAKLSPRVRMIDNPARITPFAMNAGIREAKGRYVAILGSHNRYAEDYLARAVEVLGETGADNVGGAMSCEATGVVQQAIAAAFHSPFSAGGARWHDPTYEGPSDTVFGGVYLREIFDKVGLFDESLVRNQDDEWNLRLVRSGGRIWQSPKIRSWYRPRDSLGKLFDQYRQYGYWKVRVIQKHRIPASVRHLIPGAFVGALLISALVSTVCILLGSVCGVAGALAVGVWSGRILAAILGTYLLLICMGSLQTARESSWLILPILPLVFATYHVGYGIGFLEGVVDFLLLRRTPNQSRQEVTR